MKKTFLLAVVVAASSMLANAATVSFNCTAFPVTFNNGAGSNTVSCPALSGVGAVSLNGVSLTYYVDYQFGGSTGTNTINTSFTPTSPAGVTWNLATTVVTDSGTASSPGIQTGSASATTGGNVLSNFTSPFSVTISPSVTGGSVATSSGAVSVTYNYNPATPEPATVSLIGLSLVGLGFLARKRKA